jgi:alkylated DNA repair dioxygenase AlkB
MTNDGAIDFMQLLAKERRRARQAAKCDTSTLAKGDDKPANPPPDHDLLSRLTWDLQISDRWNPSPLDMDRHCICESPGYIYYMDSFLPTDYCQALTTWLRALPRRQQAQGKAECEETRDAVGHWTQLCFAKRNVALFDSRLEAFPEPLDKLARMLHHCGVFPEAPPNHILINDYEPHQGILAHTDGPAYKSRTATISLGGDVLLWFTPRLNNKIDSGESVDSLPMILSGKGSMVVFTDSAYLDYMHSIQDRVEEEHVPSNLLSPNAIPTGSIIQRKPRISLTFRIKR